MTWELERSETEDVVVCRNVVPPSCWSARSDCDTPSSHVTSSSLPRSVDSSPASSFSLTCEQIYWWVYLRHRFHGKLVGLDRLPLISYLGVRRHIWGLYFFYNLIHHVAPLLCKFSGLLSKMAAAKSDHAIFMGIFEQTAMNMTVRHSFGAA